MKLYATPLSHFSRKVRILLDHLSIPYEFKDVGNVAEGDLDTFAGNPLLKVPVLVDGDSWLIESDHIAAHLVQKFDPSDRFNVLTRNSHDLNIRAVLNGIMTEEVKVILARRTGVPTDKYGFFDDALEAMKNGLQWLEDNADFNPSNPGYKDFHLVCAWEHFAHYEILPMNFRKLESVVTQVLQNPVVRKTSPFVLKPKDQKS